MPLNFVRYKHARFSARFPDSFRYSPSHYWMAQVEGEPGLWRVGFTKFATRMLGELVDCEWQVPQGGPVEPGTGRWVGRGLQGGERRLLRNERLL
jgi:glycine cleavage system H protein